MSTKIDVDVRISEVEAKGINKKNETVIRAIVESLKTKKMIMKNKNKLRGTQCYTESELTEEERVQKKLREIAQIEKIRVLGYQKLCVNGE